MDDYLYIIMCGGTYKKWETPRQLTEINGESIVARTIRLLRENGIENIAISSNTRNFDDFYLPVLTHKNDYVARGCDDTDGYWCDGFYPIKRGRVCYLFGDVVFSPEAIKTIVETEVDSIQFFASAPPFSPQYSKKWAEPFALKVNDVDLFRKAIDKCKDFQDLGKFDRKPIMWELWQIIKETPINHIDFTNYKVINDYTCDIDNPEDIKFFEDLLND